MRGVSWRVPTPAPWQRLPAHPPAGPDIQVRRSSVGQRLVLVALNYLCYCYQKLWLGIMMVNRIQHALTNTSHTKIFQKIVWLNLLKKKVKQGDT